MSDMRGWLRASPGLFASGVLHVGILAALLMTTGRPFEVPAETPLDVEIVEMPPVNMLPLIVPAVLPPLRDMPRLDVPKDALPVAPAPPPPAHAGRITAHSMLGAAALAEPRNQPVREAMKRLAPEEKIRQLCGIEALAQIAAWNADFKPEQLVAYATAPLAMTAGLLIARGAAVLSHGQWFALWFSCTLRGGQRVDAFSFELGDAIPRHRWASYNLPSVARPLE